MNQNITVLQMQLESRHLINITTWNAKKPVNKKWLPGTLQACGKNGLLVKFPCLCGCYFAIVMPLQRQQQADR